MHIIAIRREVYEQNRWVAQSLYKAFDQAQQEVYARTPRNRRAASSCCPGCSRTSRKPRS